MKAMVLKGPNTPFVLSNVPDPVPGPGEAVARVLACGSGLTIQHVKAGRIAAEFPRIIGHEITGEIVAVGDGVSGLAVGDGVTSYYYLNCNHCRWCLSMLEPLCANSGGNVGRNCDGGYAEYIKLPAHIFIKLPEGLDYRAHPAEIGVVMDALATPYKVLKRARVRAGETVAVFGAGGGVGIHQVMLAKWAHARVIAVDVAPGKLDACRKAGADEVVDASAGRVAQALLDLTKGEGVDVAIDYVSSTSTLEAGAQSLGRHGRLVTLGGAGQPFRASSMDMLLKEQDLLGSRYVTRSEILETLDLVARREVWPIVTEIRPLEEAEALHERIERGLVTGRAALLIQDRKEKTMNPSVRVCTAILMAVWTSGAFAQAYPAKPIRIVVPFSAGGPADITTRTIAPRLTELLGQPIVVDNRAGANGVIGADNVIKSPPDGYSLLMATASVAAINMVTYAKPPYDSLRDLQPLTPVMTTSSLIVVHPSMPVTNLKALVALAKARPNEIAFGSAGTGGTLHLGLEMLMKDAGVKITHVPYKGAAPAVVDVVAGQINGMFVDLPVISPYVRSGRVRALATANPQRTQHFPDIPTAKEAGFPTVEMTNYYAMLAPAKTPREIVVKLHDAIVKTVATPAVREKLLSVGADPQTMDIDEFTRYLRADIAKWDKLVKSVGIQFER